MDGRLAAGLLTIALPAALVGVTIVQFSSNPLAILGLLAVIFGGSMYLLTYTETF